MSTKTPAKSKKSSSAPTKDELFAEAASPRRNRKVKTGEVAAAYNPDNPYGNWGGKAPYLRAYNPDDLVKSKNNGIKIYQDMTREPVVKAALMQKVTSLLSVPWGVKPASSDPEHVAQAKFVTWNMKRLKGGFARDVYEMCDALIAGYSIQEKIYDIIPDYINSDYAGMVRLSALKSKDPYYFGFSFDEYMNILPDGVMMVQGALGENNVPLPADKFFIFSFLKKYENLYGQSDLRAAYRAFWIKDTAWKLRAVYMERFSGNNLKGKYPRNKNQEENKAALIEIFKKWQSETGVAIPDDLEIEVMQVATSSDSEYARAMADCNVDIAIGILGESLTINEGRKTGARNMGEIHKEVVDLFIMFLDMILTSDINEQIIQPLIDLNYPGVSDYPEFYWYPREDYDPQTFGDAIQKWQQAGAKISISWFYERTRMPIPSGPEDEMKPVQPPVIQGPGAGGQGPGGQVPGQDQNLNREGAMGARAALSGGEPPAKLAEPVPAQGKYYREPDKFEKYAEIENIDKQTMTLVDGAKADAAPAYLKVKASILDQVQKRQVLQNKDFEAAAKIAVNTKPLQEVIQHTLLTADLMGRASAVKNVRNQGYSPKGLVKKFAEADNWETIDAPVTPEEAVKYFSGKIPMTKEQYQALIDAEYKQAFYIAGLEKTQITGDVQDLLTQALKNGWDDKKFKFELDREFDDYAKASWEQQGDTSEKITDAHAETVFRTNIMDAYNQGRTAVLSDSDVAGFFPAWQYSAILDGRTRPTHAAMDGAVFLADDPIWDKITPPAGYNCRCTIVPINKYDFTEDMLWDPSDIPAGFPDDGF